MLLSWRLVKWRRQNSHDRQTWIKNGNLKRKKEILNMIQKLNSASRDYETITVNLMTPPPPPRRNEQNLEFQTLLWRLLRDSLQPVWLATPIIERSSSLQSLWPRMANSTFLRAWNIKACIHCVRHLQIWWTTPKNWAVDPDPAAEKLSKIIK